MKCYSSKLYCNLIADNSLITCHSSKNSSFDEVISYIRSKSKSLTIIQMKQIHSAKNVFIKNNPGDCSKIIIKNIDALFTMEKNIALIVKSADCLPILFSHPKGLIGCVHAGRKGTEQKIIAKTLARIATELNFKKDFSFWFGPAICSDCYQIDKKRNLYFDLKSENLNQIIKVLGPSNFKINYSTYCTSCNNDLFYSYRKDQKTINLIYHAIALQS